MLLYKINTQCYAITFPQMIKKLNDNNQIFIKKKLKCNLKLEYN